MRSLFLILKDIKIEHTLFAMPFAVMSAFIASKGVPDTEKITLILLALVFARSAAMAFNRLTDMRFDSQNPRTKERPLAAGKVNRGSYIFFVVFNSIAFIVTAYFLNSLSFYLSPIALAIIFFYSLTKRFTPYSHFFLGLALAIAPIGAWIAVTGGIGYEAILLGIAVIFWLVGLDIIYSCQDVEHDKSMGLFSIPSAFGIENALIISASVHAIMVAMLATLFMASPLLSDIYRAGVIITAGLLIYQHSIVKPNDLRRVNVAFFNINGIISVGLMVLVIVDTLV